MWWSLTLTYILKVIRPWLWKSCPLCNVFSSRSIISILATNNHYHSSLCRVSSFYKILKFKFFANFSAFTLKKKILQFCLHSFHIWHKSSLASEAFTLFWLGIWYELVNGLDLGFKTNWSIVWVIMVRRGVSSERRRSSCSSFYLVFLVFSGSTF